MIELVQDDVAGDPVHGRRWIRRSLSSLQGALHDAGHALGRETIRRLLGEAKVSLKGNVKRLTPKAHPHTGSTLYPDAPELLILADGGGSNGYRTRLRKEQLQTKLVDVFGLPVTVALYPPGASKWNPIEHRLFSETSKTWAGTPLTSIDLMLDCIRDTKTAAGLTVQATLVDKTYPKGIKVSDQQMDQLVIEHHATCPNWNHTIRPKQTGKSFSGERLVPIPRPIMVRREYHDGNPAPLALAGIG